MIINFRIPDKKIKTTSMVYTDLPNVNKFPIACIGRDSYVVDAIIHNEIETTIPNGYGINNLQIGKFVSIARGVTFCMGINHNYLALAMGVSDLFDTKVNSNTYRMKGQILI